jgi:hypothetical protein
MASLPCSPDRITQIAYAYREAKVLLSAVELGVFTALSDGPLPLDALTAKLGIDRRGARDFLDALVALDLLSREDAGGYGNTRETAAYLDRCRADYLGGELEFINAHLYGHWNQLTVALRTGRPVNPAAADSDSFKSRYRDPAEAERFAKAMTAATRAVAQALATRFPWNAFETMVDIGTSEGCLPSEIARRHAHLRCAGFDLPALRGAFDAHIAAQGLSKSVSFIGGDFLLEPLPFAQVIVIGRVLHNWNLSTKKMLLGKAYDALPAGGAVIVYERLIDDERRTNAKALLSSLNMLVMTAGGFDFSAKDCVGWMTEAGFHDVSVQPMTSDQTAIVGRKR